eukprot:766462-Hanusia_phi.AAC.10
MAQVEGDVEPGSERMATKDGEKGLHPNLRTSSTSRTDQESSKSQEGSTEEFFSEAVSHFGFEEGPGTKECHEGRSTHLASSEEKDRSILNTLKGAEQIIQEQRQNLSKLKLLLESNVKPSLVVKRESTKCLPMLNMNVIRSDSDLGLRRLSMESTGNSEITPSYSSISAKTRSRKNSSELSSSENTPTSVFFPELTDDKTILEGAGMSWEEASYILESRDLIAAEHSSAENAAHLLQQFMRQCSYLAITDRAIITYAIKTLQSDEKISSIPQALFSPNQVQGSPIIRHKSDATSGHLQSDLVQEKMDSLNVNDVEKKMKVFEMALIQGDDQLSCVPDEEMRSIYDLIQHEVSSVHSESEDAQVDQDKFQEQLTSTWMVYTRLKERIMTLLDKYFDKRSGSLKRKGLALLMKDLIFDYEPRGEDVERILKDAKMIGKGNAGRGQLTAAIVVWYKNVKEQRGLLKRDKPAVSDDVKEWILSFFTPFSGTPVFSAESQGGTPRPRSSINTPKYFMDRIEQPLSVSITDDNDLPIPAHWSDAESQQLAKVLENVDEWGWSPFELAEASGMRPIQALGWHLLSRWNVMEELMIDESTMRNWLAFVESKYKKNPYHNAIHASDILQTVHFMLHGGNLARYMTQRQITAILLAALVHDLGHDGLNNNYHKNSISQRALMYNDQSIQENYHLFLLFSSMDAKAEIDIFHRLSQENFWELRKSIIDMVLFTDMSKHFMLLKDLKETCEADSLEDKLCAASDLLMKAVLHVSDISNPAKPQELAISWTERCIEEFFLQGDQEKALGLPVSPQCNRETTSIPDSQIGFIEFVVLPSFQVLSTALPVIKDVCLPNLQANLLYWKEKKEELQATLSRKSSE